MACLGDQLGMEFSPEEIAECRSKKGLLSIELELSRICNLRCLYCYASSGNALENELSLEEILDVVDQAIAMGAKKIIVLGGGEPLLYPHLFEVLDHIRNQGLIADMFTNGLTLTDEVAEKLFARQVGVVLKMNSRNAEVQDYLGGREGTYAAIEKAYAALTKAGYPSEECSLGVQTIICQQNYDELPELWRWARQQGVAPYVEAMTMQGRANEYKDLAVTPEQVRTIFEELSRIDKEEFQCEWIPHPPLVASQCARHEYSCTVTSIGNIQPCVGVDLVAGNIREKKLADIINDSEAFRDLRNIRETIKGKCKTCDVLENCYGCRGHAYHVEGDYLAADPLCWLVSESENDK